MKVVPEHKIKFKRIDENDLEILMNWRNNEEVSRYLFSSPKLVMADQLNWYEKYKNDKSQIRWIIYADDIPIGSSYLVDIDYNNKRCESGWFIAERQYRSMNMTLTIRWNVFDYVFETLGLNRQYGYVLAENKGLVRFARVGGPEIEGMMKEHIFKDGRFLDVYILGITQTMWKEKKEQFEYDRIIME